MLSLASRIWYEEEVGSVVEARACIKEEVGSFVVALVPSKEKVGQKKSSLAGEETGAGKPISNLLTVDPLLGCACPPPSHGTMGTGNRQRRYLIQNRGIHAREPCRSVFS